MADREEHRSLLDDDDEDEEDEGSRHLSPLCDPRHLLHRILVLLFMCFLGFGKNNPDDESQDTHTHHPHKLSIKRYIRMIACGLTML